ncbi:MAG: hypothetical protein WC964_02805 [Acholeplasmataceae bacterium]
MRVEYFNVLYFLFIFLGIASIILTIWFLNKKSEKFRYWFLFGLLLSAFIIHFLKIFIFPYTLIDSGILRKVSFENVCAVSTLVFPWIYLSKNKTLKDFMVMLGITSGLLTFLIPIDAVSPFFDGRPLAEWMGVEGPVHRELFGIGSLELVRFYYTHLIIILVPFVMMFYKIHQISIKRAFWPPIYLIGLMVVIFINELILTAVGWVPKVELFDPSKRNPSIIFGIKPDVKGMAMIVLIFVPSFMRLAHPSGFEYLLPVVWMIIPILIYGSIIAFIYCFIYDRAETKKFIKKLFRKQVDSEIASV